MPRLFSEFTFQSVHSSVTRLFSDWTLQCLGFSVSGLYDALPFQWLHVSVRTLFCSRASPFTQALRLQSKWFHRTRGAPCPWCTIYRDSRQCSEPSSVCNLRWTMSWVQGPIDPPPPHQNLKGRTRAFYGAHNALPLEFWLHATMEMMLLYRSTSILVMPKEGSSVALTTRFSYISPVIISSYTQIYHEMLTSYSF